MVRGKKGRKSEFRSQAVEESVVQAVSREEPKKQQRYSIVDYILVTVFFTAFCFLQQSVAGYMLGRGGLEDNSLEFFFGTLWKGFIVVAILAWIIDYFSNDIEEDDTA